MTPAMLSGPQQVTGSRIGHMEDCAECDGTGRSPYSKLPCRKCYGAGEVEVWSEDEPTGEGE